MNNTRLQKKLHQLKWLKYSGIEYFSSLQKHCNNIKVHDRSKDNKSIIKNQISISPNLIPKKQNSCMINQARVLADKATTIAELKKFVENFNGCELKNFALNTVFSDGVDSAQIVFIGEAPGAQEDNTGIPFCGESGKLLDNMLATIDLVRSKNIYITNTVFWRPPANRCPSAEEINICRPFVEKHIALIKPKILIPVGKTAAHALLGINESMANFRSNEYSYQNQYLKEPIQTIVIFHPAYLLRQPMKKKDMWFDLLKIKNIISSL